MKIDLGFITTIFVDNDSYFTILQDLKPKGNL